MKALLTIGLLTYSSIAPTNPVVTNNLSEMDQHYTADVPAAGDGPTYCTIANSTGKYEIPVKNKNGDTILIIGRICSNYDEVNKPEGRLKIHYVDSHTTTSISSSSSKGEIILSTTFFRIQSPDQELQTVSDGHAFYTCPQRGDLVSDDRSDIKLSTAVLVNASHKHAIQHINVYPKAGAGC